jgi:nitroreductase
MAQSLGLATCYIGYFYPIAHKSPEIRATLDIPEGDEVLMTFTIGYPSVQFRRLVDRDAPFVRWVDGA